MSSSIAFRRGRAADLATAEMWLGDAGLPTADLTPEHMGHFLVAILGGGTVGVIGLESYGDLGLLRSLIVDPDRRHAGIGRQLVEALEDHARGAGIAELWLLTIDAEAYFSKRGYVIADRSDAPEAIRSTREFASLCPDDAALMRKAL